MSGDMQSGNVVQMSVQLDAEGRVTDARFKAFGSGPVFGCAAFLCDWAKGKTLAELGDCATLDLLGRFEIHAWFQAKVSAPIDALLAVTKEAKLALGKMSPEEVEMEAAAKLAITPELFDEAAFAEQVERVADALPKVPSLDWARVGLRVAAAVMGHTGQDAPDPTTRSAAELLADVRHLDGGLRQDVATRVLDALSARATSSKGGA